MRTKPLGAIDIVFELDDAFNERIPDEQARSVRSLAEMIDGVRKLTGLASGAPALGQTRPTHAASGNHGPWPKSRSLIIPPSRRSRRTLHRFVVPRTSEFSGFPCQNEIRARTAADNTFFE